jgi:hypothetical protein
MVYLKTVNKQLDFQNNIESSKLTELSDKLENLPHERINPNIIDSLTGDLKFGQLREFYIVLEI